MKKSNKFSSIVKLDKKTKSLVEEARKRLKPCPFCGHRLNVGSYMKGIVRVYHPVVSICIVRDIGFFIDDIEDFTPFMRSAAWAWNFRSEPKSIIKKLGKIEL